MIRQIGPVMARVTTSPRATASATPITAATSDSVARKTDWAWAARTCSAASLWLIWTTLSS